MTRLHSTPYPLFGSLLFSDTDSAIHSGDERLECVDKMAEGFERLGVIRRYFRLFQVHSRELHSADVFGEAVHGLASS